jgi:hypothetical protein
MSRFIQDVEGIVVTKRRDLGGPGSGNFGHAGRPGEQGGSAPADGGGGGGGSPKEDSQEELRRRFEDPNRRRWPEPKTDEEREQDRLATAQSNPLAKPDFVLGMDNDINGETTRYVAAYGQEFKAAPLPEGVEPGTKQECYKNASLLVMSRPDLTYVEGFAKNGEVGDHFSFMHAWAVDKDNNVIDPTWDNPEKNQYFGVKYDREKYLKYLYKAEIYGVLGSTFDNARNAIKTGGKKLR